MGEDLKVKYFQADPSQIGQLKRERTAADEAQEVIQKYGVRYATKVQIYRRSFMSAHVILN